MIGIFYLVFSIIAYKKIEVFIKIQTHSAFRITLSKAQISRRQTLGWTQGLASSDVGPVYRTSRHYKCD
jgi:hypothetical protein